MTMPWWGWATMSVFGYAGTALICARLTTTGMSSASVNFYLFGIGFVVFALFAYCTQTNLSLATPNLLLLVLLAITLFVSNFAVVAAYGCAPNAGLVKAIGTLDLVVVAVAVTMNSLMRDGSFGFTSTKVVGMLLCLVGAILVAWDH